MIEQCVTRCNALGKLSVFIGIGASFKKKSCECIEMASYIIGKLLVKMFSLVWKVICPSPNSISKAKKNPECIHDFLRTYLELNLLHCNQIKMSLKLPKDQSAAETIFAKCYGHVGSCELLFLMGI